MPDFIGYVRRNLPRPDAPVARYDEVVEDLASELETRYTALVQGGASDEDAWRIGGAQGPSWPALARDLAAADGRHAATTRVSRLRRYLAIEHWARECAVAMRVLRRDRGFTVTAIVTLAVCLGGHAA